MIYAYLRVSAKDQNLERQILAVKNYRSELKDENIFNDKISGKNFDRAEYQRLKEIIAPGDELIVKELDRFGRNKEEIKSELRWFSERKVITRILDVPTTLLDFQGQEWLFEMVNNILIEVLGAVAEQERKKILERQKEGIAAMPIVDGKRVSLKTGRPMGNQFLEVPLFKEYAEKAENGAMTVVDCCRELGISRSKWYNMCKGVK